MTRRLLWFATCCVAMIGTLGFGITYLSGDAVADRTVWVSALVALVVQVGSFAVVWPIAAKNPIGGWGVGSAIRFAAVVLYAVVGVKLLGLESGPALISLVGFLFVTMLVEPLFLKR